MRFSDKPVSDQPGVAVLGSHPACTILYIEAIIACYLRGMCDYICRMVGPYSLYALTLIGLC